MAYDTIIDKGSFTSAGSAVTLDIPSDFDYIEVFNETAADTSGGATPLGFKFSLYRDSSTAGFVEIKLDDVANDPITVQSMNAGSGFEVIDPTTVPQIGTAYATTGISNATNPVVSTATTTGLVSGDIIRLSQTTAQKNTADATCLNGIDFQIDNVNSGSNFRIAGNLQQAIGAGLAAAGGSYRKIAIQGRYYPRKRFIINMTSAANAVVTTSVDHGYAVGQKVRFIVRSTLNGTVEANEQVATITAVGADNQFTCDLDTSAMTAFVFPTQALAEGENFTPAMVLPEGMNTAQALSSSVDILSDAIDNTGVLQVILAAGTLAPAGQSNDVIKWRAMKAQRVVSS